MKRLKVGVIGCGVMGSFHLKQYAAIDEVEVAGASDIDPGRECEGHKFYANYLELLDHVDAVSLTSPTSTHYEMAIKIIERGKHLLVEKPIAVTADQGREIVNRAKAKKIVLSVGHIERFNPAFLALTKALGRTRPEIIDIKRFSPFPARISDASCVIDMMIHDIDIAVKLTGSRVKHVHAAGKVERTDKLDKAFAVLIFENGTVANIEASRVHEEKVRTLTVAGGDSVLEADLLNKKLRVKARGSWRDAATGQHDQLNAELRDFVASINRKTGPAVSGEDGVAALEIANRVEELALKGGDSGEAG